MQRRKAVATAAAITMSLLSGAVALGANTGMLGFASDAKPASPSTKVVTVAPASTVVSPQQVAAPPIRGEHESGEHESGERESGEHEGGGDD